MISRLEWFTIIALAAAAFALGAPHLKDGYVGYWLSGKCPETTETTILQCSPPNFYGNGGGVTRVTRSCGLLHFDSQREFRERGIPSGLALEVYLDVYEQLASFEPGVTDLVVRLNDAYAAEVARVDQNGDGIISAAEGDIDTASDGFPNNERLFLPPTVFNRFAVTREINDGLLAPRFSPSQRAWVLSGTLVSVSPAVPASAGRDADDR